jgi:uncharacterized protein YdeI (YjbR/CyaY-like superfamily)
MSKFTVDQYLEKGCMRCPYGDTPDCKVHQWVAEIQALRAVARRNGLTEEIKWGVPCYTSEGKNIMLISAFREHCSVSFFKGALLNDEYGLLEKPGKNSHASRVCKFRSLGEVSAGIEALEDYLAQAVDVERKGLKVPPQKLPPEWPKELLEVFAEDPPLRAAFDALTPGRQRGYILYFSSPKKSSTRMARIEKNRDQILGGIGLHDKYSSKKK